VIAYSVSGMCGVATGGQEKGDKKRLKLKSKEIYRMHVGRSCTIFHEIL